MFDLVGDTQCIEGAPEFGTIVGANAARVAKLLEYFLADGIGNGGTTFIIDQSQNAELAEAANSAKDMHGIFAIT